LRKLKIRSILFFENHITKLADGLIVISKHLCSKFVDITKGSIPIQLISIAVDLDSKPQTTIPASNSGKFNIVYSGSFGNKDGLDIVFRAIRELNEEGYAVNLCLTGSKDNLHNLQGIHDHPNIKFLGYLSSEELTKLQMGADVLLMSRVNSMQNVASFPFKLGEYLLTGKPVIATSVGDVVDYLQDGVNAFLIEPESVTALKNAIIQILTNPENASFVGLVGYNTCIKYFSKEVVAQNLVRLIDSIYTSAPKDNISAPFYDKKNK